MNDASMRRRATKLALIAMTRRALDRKKQYEVILRTRCSANLGSANLSSAVLGSADLAPANLAPAELSSAGPS